MIAALAAANLPDSTPIASSAPPSSDGSSDAAPGSRKWPRMMSSTASASATPCGACFSLVHIAWVTSPRCDVTLSCIQYNGRGIVLQIVASRSFFDLGLALSSMLPSDWPPVGGQWMPVPLVWVAEAVCSQDAVLF